MMQPNYKGFVAQESFDLHPVLLVNDVKKMSGHDQLIII